MRIYLMRHGETDWNTQKRLQGRTDIELNEKGRALARVTAEALRDVPFDLAISSPLKRAKETAQIVMGERSGPVLTDERIIEISFGSYEGLSSGKDRYEIPDPGFAYFFTAPEKYHPRADAESFEALGRRTADFMTGLTVNEEYRDKTVLVTSHGAAIRALLNSVREEFDLADFWNGKVPKNCSVSILETQNGRLVLLEENRVYY